MTRYELIMHDAEKMVSELPYNEQYPAKCGYLKAEIKCLLKEIEILEERCAECQNLTNPDA